MNIDDVRSYATETNLETGLERAGLGDFRRLVVCNREGRFTAIFPLGWNLEANVGFIAQAGFMVVG